MINGRYIIQKKIGEGRSKVFSIIDTEFPEREVAAKFLPYNSSFEEKQFFRDEYFTLQSLDHPNIIKPFELGSVLIKDEEDDEIEIGSPFIILEYFNSVELLNYNKLNDEKQLYSIIKQICSVLFYLHQSNYIYYDLKAENILILEKENVPVIKLIDFGFAAKVFENENFAIRGTPNYLAPEIIKNESHDHRVDLYALGVLLYKIVYNKFPHESSDELEIYKAHLEDEVEFGDCIYSKRIIKVIEKLLKKSPLERYSNALEVLADLDIKIDFEIAKDFIPAKVFSGRKDVINIINTYINDNNSNEVFTITGFDGAGKSALLNYIYEKYQDSIFIENPGTKTGLESIKFILKKILFNEILYKDKADHIQYVLDAINKNSSEFIQSAKTVFNTLSDEFKLIILFDNYNLYDSYTIEILTSLIRIFQVKGIKVLLTESSDYDQSSLNITNIYEIQLNPFTEHHLNEFLNLSYIPSFPRDELQKYITLYSDLLPGNIKQFIKDLILMNVLQYSNSKSSFDCTEETILALQSSHEEIYRIRLSNLDSMELKLAQIISSFNISVEQTVLSALVDVGSDKLKNLLQELEKKNIISTLNHSYAPEINSFSFKKYVYSTINNKTRFHLVIANSIKRLFPDFNSVELARQFELAGEYEKAVEIINKEIVKAEVENTYGYKRTLLENSLKLPISEKTRERLYIELAKTTYKLSDYRSAIQVIYNLQIDKLTGSDLNEILFIKGSSLIELGETLEGEKILLQLKDKVSDNRLLQYIYVNLAFAEFDQNNISESEHYCDLVIKDTTANNEASGRIFNLLSIIEIQSKNNPEKALEFANLALRKYESSQLKSRMAGMLVNIGNYYDILGNQTKAQENWDEALKINSNIGNLEQESAIYINYGVYYSNLGNHELSISNFLKAINILNLIGIKIQLVSAYYNIGIAYLQICDYQKSYEFLIKAEDLFNKIGSNEDKIRILISIGRLWYILGDFEQLYKTHDKIEQLSKSISINSDQDYFYFNYLKFLLELNPANKIRRNNDFEFFFEQSINGKETDYTLEMLTIYCDYLLKTEQLDKLLNLFESKTFNELSKENIILMAYKYYFLGKISLVKTIDQEKSPINYFEDAYNILLDQSISELTWKVLYEITLIYYERGNFFKLKKPRLYSYELLNMIGENISNNNLRLTYFNHFERKKTLEKLLLIGNKTQVNEYQQSEH
ncbi:MAG: hypothetical protein B6D44_16705 [Ignavibacteriales bacterium UTCHB2]|jgi:serine/threonine protein kinase|nr:MAG: Serine/threonine-protein kinase PrkC [Ignavibacteria bacterium ADurb.Bin266]OQY69983.1 MAG: hypothetical protein B6D44_16705 [Ignavibacteriales bacterium UTCHB2]HQI41970.1 serine/threonine-protein kinase [Ignavibacteriaceae bacterium]